MAKLVWDQEGSRFYETGVKNCALYVHNGTSYQSGVAWNGITAITESPSGAEASDLYADDIKYLSLTSAETFGCSIEAYTYPDEFMQCDGSASLVESVPGVLAGQQGRKTFALVYKTTMGNDTTGNEFGYKIHIIYGCKASPSERAYSTINDSPEAITFSWEVNTTPIGGTAIPDGFKPMSNIVIDSTKFTTTEQKAKLKSIEDTLFGTDPVDQGEGSNPTIMTPKEIYTALSVTASVEETGDENDGNV